MKPIELNKIGFVSYKTGILGLAGASLALLIKTFEIQPKTQLLQIVSLCFIIAIPLLIMESKIYDIFEEPRFTEIPIPALAISLLLGVGKWFSFMGFTLFLWHFSRVYAIIMVTSSLLAVLGHAACGAFIQQHAEQQPKKPSVSPYIS